MFSDNIAKAAELMGQLDEEIKKLTEKKKALEPEVREALSGKGPQKFGDYIIEVKDSPGRKTFDKVAFAKDYSNEVLDQYMKQGAPFTTMKITKLGES